MIPATFRRNSRNWAFFLSGITALSFSAWIFFLFEPPSAEAQPGTSAFSSTDSAKELDDKIEQFFGEILKGNSTAAFNGLLLSGSYASGASGQSIAEMKAGLDKMKTQFGEIRDYEKIDMRPVGKSQDLILVRYLMKFESYPVVWTFNFYRRPADRGSLTTAPNPWIVVGIRYDSNLDLLLAPGF